MCRRSWIQFTQFIEHFVQAQHTYVTRRCVCVVCAMRCRTICGAINAIAYIFIYFLQGNRGYIGCAPVTFDVTCLSALTDSAKTEIIYYIIISSYDEWQKLSLFSSTSILSTCWEVETMRGWYWIWSITNLALVVVATTMRQQCGASLSNETVRTVRPTDRPTGRPPSPALPLMRIASTQATPHQTILFNFHHYVFLIYLRVTISASERCLPENISLESTKNSTFCSSSSFLFIYHRRPSFITTKNFCHKIRFVCVCVCEWDAMQIKYDTS